MYDNDRSMYIYVAAAIVVYTIVTHLSIVMILGHLNRTHLSIVMILGHLNRTQY